jgi:hypothetical protein
MSQSGRTFSVTGGGRGIRMLTAPRGNADARAHLVGGTTNEVLLPAPSSAGTGVLARAITSRSWLRPATPSLG